MLDQFFIQEDNLFFDQCVDQGKHFELISNIGGLLNAQGIVVDEGFGNEGFLFAEAFVAGPEPGMKPEL